MSIIEKFLATIRRKRFAQNAEREIYHKIFPHLNGRADHGYPFSSDAQLEQKNKEDFYKLSKCLEEIYLAAGRMPTAQGEAFRHIAARNLDAEMRMILLYASARKREQPCPQGQQYAEAAA
jgi:hypothetical protein